MTVAGMPWRDFARRGRDVALLCLVEVGSFAAGAVFLLGLASIVLTVLAVGTVGFLLGELRDEAVRAWRSAKGDPQEADEDRRAD